MRRSTRISSVSTSTPLEQSAPQLGAPSEILLAEPLLACLKSEAGDRAEARGAPQHSVQATPMRSHINRTVISEDCREVACAATRGKHPGTALPSSVGTIVNTRTRQSTEWLSLIHI